MPVEQSTPAPPVHQAPVELLCTIFEYVMSYFQGLARLKAVINLSQINRRLRDVAIGNPLLWSHIVLSKSLPQETCETFLQRASNTALHLTILFDSNNDSSFWTLPGSNLLRPLVSRWTTVVIQPSETPAYPVGLNVDPAKEIVKTIMRHDPFAIRTMEFRSCNVLMLPTDYDGTCHLRSLKLVRSTLKIDLPVHFPYLKTMDLHLFQQDERPSCERVLGHLPVLETLSISGSGLAMDRTQDQLTLPSLKSLSVTGKDLLFGRSFLRRAAVPLLRSLTLGPGGLQALPIQLAPRGYGTALLFEPLEHFAWVGSTRMGSRMKWPPIGRDALYADAIKQLPNATSHFLDDPSGRSLGTMLKLSAELGARVILPSLQRLTISQIDVYIEVPVPRILHEFIQLRQKAGLPPIQYLSIHIRNTGVPRQDATEEKLRNIEIWMEFIKSNVKWFELEGEETDQEVYFPEELRKDTAALTETQDMEG